MPLSAARLHHNVAAGQEAEGFDEIWLFAVVSCVADAVVACVVVVETIRLLNVALALRMSLMLTLRFAVLGSQVMLLLTSFDVINCALCFANL